MMYHLALAGFTLVSLVIQSIFPQAVFLAWATPDFLLLLVVFNAMFRGPVYGGAAGFLIGLAEDFFFGRFIGLNALAKCVVGFLAGSMAKSIFKENIWVPVIGVLAGSALSLGIVYAAGHLAGARWYLGNIIFQAGFELLINICLVPFLYGPFFHFADRRLKLREED